MGNSFSTSAAGTSSSPLSSLRADAGGPHRIAIAPEVQLRQLHATTPVGGTPRYVAVRPKASEGSGVQRWEALFYPTPDEDLTLEYRYSVIPAPLSESHPYPLGGRQYAELLLQSCLAVAEERSGKTEGVAAARFLGRLAAAIQQDVQSLQPTEDGIWPLGEEADGLGITKAYLKRLVGRNLKYGPHPGAWTHKQTQEVELAVQTGLRKFYSPPVLPKEKNSHEWSFLRPVMNMTMVADQYIYDLPADFAMTTGPITYAPGSSVIYPSIQIVGEHQLRSRLQRSSAAARPEIAAIRPKQMDGISGSRYEMLLWPTPEDSHEIQMRYQINPAALDDETSLPLGGQPHHQTIVEACLAAAEEQTGEAGLHGALFLQRIISSVAYDRKSSAPDGLGVNVDRSDYPADWNDQWHGWNENVVTYGGAEI
jgi:hypothetical protein